MTSRRLLLIVAALCFAAADGSAATRLGTPFTDHMMVQADRRIPMWGWDDAGRVVTVRLGDQTAQATADAGGHWRADLPPLPAGGAGLTLTVEGTGAVAVRDVIVGDVYWCSGQSNMTWPVSRSDSADEVLAGPANPRLRLLQLPRQSLDEPAATADAAWRVAGPDTLGDFSAVAYHFGRALQRGTGRPIGLVHGSWAAPSSARGCPPTRWPTARSAGRCWRTPRRIWHPTSNEPPPGRPPAAGAGGPTPTAAARSTGRRASTTA